MAKRLATLAAAVFALAFASSASADGEVGLVLQEGDTVTTYCVPYTGDGITGAELLQRAGLSIEQFGGSGGRTVCAIGQTGCFDSSSFTSCFCECQGGDCTYWAFFTREYGKNWLYSSLAFNLLRAEDGDVHGWKWGQGSPNSAPAPQDVTFDAVCGHAPRGGAQQPATATATTPSVATARPPTAAAGETSVPMTAAASESPSASSTVPSTVAGEAPTVTVTIAGPAVATVAPPASGEGGEGSSSASLIAFGAIAGVLVMAIAGAFAWRARRGA